jgi:transcriptional regulator with XRE-family HTH domain
VSLVPRADYTTPPAELERLGNAVRTLRTDRDLKQIEVATNAGMTESQISDIENARNNPGWLLITRLVTEGLGLELRDLVDAYERADGDPPEARR